jgi:curved DNA-binding protein CbpA
MAKDYYIVLGVSRGADIEKIKKAYRRVAKKYHPDVAQSEEGSEKFREIREAYETLVDDENKKRGGRFAHPRNIGPARHRGPSVELRHGTKHLDRFPGNTLKQAYAGIHYMILFPIRDDPVKSSNTLHRNLIRTEAHLHSPLPVNHAFPAPHRGHIKPSGHLRAYKY